MKRQQFESMFSGVIGKDYDMLKLICPLAAEMSRRVGEAVEDIGRHCDDEPLQVLELGGGTGITTLSILMAGPQFNILSVDNEPTMQRQAQQNLSEWTARGRLQFLADDALTALQKQQENSFDLMASAYTLHNFEHGYRQQVIEEIYRVLKPGGSFINGDRYALNDISMHTATIQQEVAGYFRVLKAEQRLDLLEQWIIHLFNDESENHVMREQVALRQLEAAGFRSVKLSHRMEVNALVTARK